MKIGKPWLHKRGRIAALAGVQNNINAGWLFRKGAVLGAEADGFNVTGWKSVELLHTNNPSGSEEICREQKEAGRMEVYAEMIDRLDQNIGRVLNEFTAPGLRAVNPI